MNKILFVLCSTLKARYYPPTIPDLRDKLERSEDTERIPQDLMELIAQHGARGWVDALIGKAGPTIQLHLEDSADLMEVLTKYAILSHPLRPQAAVSCTWRFLCLLYMCATRPVLTILASKNGAIQV